MTLFESVFAGNDAVYGLTENAIDQAIETHGADKAVSFPNTAYSLPCYYAVTGTKVGTLAELKEALAVVKTLMTREKRTHDAFMSGVATALCAEFIEVLKYIDGATPYEEPCYGHLADAVIRELGVPLVTGDIPGVAVILGKAASAEEAAALVKSYQAQGILVTLVGDIIDQLAEINYKTGANVRVIPLGKDVTSVIHVVSVALRAALIFGNVKPGDAATLMEYTMKRVPAFVNAFAPLNDVIVACGAGAIALGFPGCAPPPRAGRRRRTERRGRPGQRARTQIPRNRAQNANPEELDAGVGSAGADLDPGSGIERGPRGGGANANPE